MKTDTKSLRSSALYIGYSNREGNVIYIWIYYLTFSPTHTHPHSHTPPHTQLKHCAPSAYVSDQISEHTHHKTQTGEYICPHTHSQNHRHTHTHTHTHTHIA